MKLLRTICVLGLTLCLATGVYAATQSVKISGDLTIRGIARGDYDLNRNHAEPGAPTSTATTADPEPGTDDWRTWAMTTTELQIDADLTDNVSAVIRLFNQRDWNVSSKDIADTQRNVELGRGEGASYTADGTEYDVGVDIAYIELKEFLYSPLTLRIGRQDLWFGKGFIVGANLKDYNANISADEYTAMTSFDAIRATLDYDPWTIDAIYTKIWENEIGSSDDEDILGVNVGYIFDIYNAEAETYWFFKNDDQIQARKIENHNTVHTFGVRGSADPIENWTVAAEGAFQIGEFVGFRDQLEERDRLGWAVDASAECRYFKEQYPWKPVFGAEYILYSGDNDEYPTAQSSGTFYGWDPMYRGKFDTAYREFVGKYNFTHQGWLARRTSYVYSMPDASYSNQHQAIIFANAMPTDSLSVDGRVAFFWQQHARAYPNSLLNPGGTDSLGDTSKRKRFMGTELDLQLTWDYTEDVSFGVLTAWFFPGGHYFDQSDDIATDVVGTVKLSF